MPNGGTHHCQGCSNHDEKQSRCTLRNVRITDPYYTTCNNRGPTTFRHSRSTPDATPNGPIYAITGPGGAYCELPYLCGERPSYASPEGIEVQYKGKTMMFKTVEEYFEFRMSTEDDGI